MIPYLKDLVESLKKLVIDPIPLVRGISANALGKLMDGIGERKFPPVIPWLLQTMRSDTAKVERLGAAQALAEVLGALDIERFETLLPDIIELSENKKEKS